MKRRDFLRGLPAIPLAIAGVVTQAATPAPRIQHVIHLDRGFSQEAAHRIREAWDAAYRLGRTIVVGPGIRVEKLER